MLLVELNIPLKSKVLMGKKLSQYLLAIRMPVLLFLAVKKCIVGEEITMVSWVTQHLAIEILLQELLLEVAFFLEGRLLKMFTLAANLRVWY